MHIKRERKIGGRNYLDLAQFMSFFNTNNSVGENNCEENVSIWQIHVSSSNHLSNKTKQSSACKKESCHDFVSLISCYDIWFAKVAKFLHTSRDYFRDVNWPKILHKEVHLQSPINTTFGALHSTCSPSSSLWNNFKTPLSRTVQNTLIFKPFQATWQEIS